MEEGFSLMEPQRTLPIKPEIRVWYNDSFLLMTLQVIPKKGMKRGEIKRVDLIAESVLSLELNTQVFCM